MSSSSINYLPTQNNVSSRNQSSCTYISPTTNDNVYNPLTNQTMSLVDANNQTQMFNKANILQYKANSSSITKNQQYAQICKGFGPNRTKAYANNPCKNQTIINPSCYLTTCSDVPGKQEYLCFNKKMLLKPWFPSVKRKMTNSANKFPINYKGFTIAVKPTPPTLFFINDISNIVSLNWEIFASDCLPITDFNIYQNNVFIQKVSSEVTTFSINISSTSKIMHFFYVTSVSDYIESSPSNIIRIA